MHEDDVVWVNSLYNTCFKHKVDRSAQSYTLYTIVYYIYYITRILWVNIPNTYTVTEVLKVYKWSEV